MKKIKQIDLNKHDTENETQVARAETILWVEDFETAEDAVSWTTDSGWELTENKSNSPTHSMNSPNNESTFSGVWDLISPAIDLTEINIEADETMHFSFSLYVDMPDFDGDSDDYLDDYYQVAIAAVSDAGHWHAVNDVDEHNDYYWCGDEETGGYADSWLEFMDTPPFIVPTNGTLTADMEWAIESSAGANLAGSCTDGWDAANVRISTDGGQTWDLLRDSQNAYNFDCGYGWIFHDSAYEEGGDLNHLAAGWGGTQDWNNFSFDLSSYASQEAIVRFAFGSDPAYSIGDNPTLTGLRVDNIIVSGSTLDCSPETSCEISVNASTWEDLFYDYGDAFQPGYKTWEEYEPGVPWNGNLLMDISDFAGKEIQLKFQSRYDDNHDGGDGTGLFIDDVKIYTLSNVGYPAPTNLTAAAGDSEVHLSWSDMNASGTEDFVYHNGDFPDKDGIVLTNEGQAWAGELFDIVGTSTVNSITVYSLNEDSVDVSIGGFLQQPGAVFLSEYEHLMDVTLQSGDNTFNVDWEMNNSFIIAHTFTNLIVAGLDSSGTSENSMVLFNNIWRPWADSAGANDEAHGEWGISANITFAGAEVTYNVYRDGATIQNNLTNNEHFDLGLTNNTTYQYNVSATYAEGYESDLSDPVSATLTDSVTTLLSIDIASGWNWFSLNVEGDDMSMSNVMNSLTSTEGDFIKSASASSTYYEGFGWYGGLTELGVTGMYKFKSANAAELTFSGDPVNPLSTPIDLASGWNWIGFTPQNDGPTNDGLATITVDDGDFIKNQGASSTYYEGFGWYGGLEVMSPTEGYMLSVAEASTLIYPDFGLDDARDEFLTDLDDGIL